MRRYWLPLLMTALLFAGTAIDATAQNAKAAAHVAAAKAAAAGPGENFSGTFDAICKERKPGEQGAPTAAEPADFSKRPIPTRAEWYVEPVKVFDNLYNVGTSFHVWAVNTSQGIILLNSGKDYSAEGVFEGLKKVGLDPANVKYVVILAPHDLHYGSAKRFQDMYRAKVVLSEKDWSIIERTKYVPASLKPKKDVVATDGMKLTLGDTTLTIYLTPGHGPASLSILVPLKDGNQRHLGALVGGRDWNYEEEGLLYFTSEEEAIRTWKASALRFRDIAEKAGVDVFLATRSHHDNTLKKVAGLKTRKPGEPHPYVDTTKKAIPRYMTIISECMGAQLAWRGKE
jgi:glyoxylase-like metal-dependent hydrolase (beta-lactamase superfamily II)